jgi:hypothetical protein
MKVLPWPKRLCDVPADAPARLLRQVENSYYVIPAGAIGTASRGKDWSRFNFRTDPCECCGLRAVISRIDQSDLELIEP